MGLAFTQVDAFADKPFAGNPAAVILLPEPRDCAWMQLVAREMNLSETAFLVKRGLGYDLRWFTPAVEVDLCGHATLASAHVLWEQGHLSLNEAPVFQTKSGALAAKKKGTWIEMDFPATPAKNGFVPDDLEVAIGMKAMSVGRSRFDYIAEVESEDAVRTCSPDFSKIGRLQARGLIVTSRASSSGIDYVSRFLELTRIQLQAQRTHAWARFGRSAWAAMIFWDTRPQRAGDSFARAARETASTFPARRLQSCMANLSSDPKVAPVKLDPKPDNPCFGCGGANPRGMKLSFEQDDARQRIVGRFRLGEEYQGGSGFLHGGMIALLLDEAMSKTVRFHGEHAVTAELRIEYKRPIPVNTEIVVEGFVTRRDGRQLYHEGEIRNEAGELLARGEGRFAIVDRNRYRERGSGQGAANLNS